MTQALQLVRAHKIGQLLPKEKHAKRWEASGLLLKDGHYFVVFDDRTEIARISQQLHRIRANRLCGIARNVSGFEGITYNAASDRYYLLVEAHQHADGKHQALIVEYDHKFKYLKQRPVDFTFHSSNKGFEAVAWLRRKGTDYLLALCEGNKCACGAKGRKPGGGRIQLFEKKKNSWRHLEAIALPKSLPFEDYSGMSIRDDRVAVVSQVNSLLWVGQFNAAKWTWHNSGQLYEFPRRKNGDIRYGNIEGVAWITPTRIAAVSDRRKKQDQPDKRLVETDQSLHVFQIPR